MNDTYVVPFQGTLLECATGLDAVDVALADRVLTGAETVGRVEIDRLARVLDRYGRAISAEKLRSERVRELLRA
jgi:acetylornithine/succinyldiaminopimelate/putrescine aminotransferase